MSSTNSRFIFSPCSETLRYYKQMSELIRLSLTPTEGMLIGVFLDGAIAQYEAASIEERQDPDLQKMYDICKKLRPFLPKAEQP